MSGSVSQKAKSSPLVVTALYVVAGLTGLLLMGLPA